MNSIPAFEIDEQGNVHTLYHEALDLFAMGTVCNVHRASHIRFDEAAQVFVVVDAKSGDEVHRNKSRTQAIEWEIQHFAPGGELYKGR